MTPSDLIMLGGGALVGLSYAKTPLMGLINKIRAALSALPAPGNATTHDSDKPAPDGFADHVKLILQAAPNASADVQIDYLEEALSEYDVLKKEVTRLSGIQTGDV